MKYIILVLLILYDVFSKKNNKTNNIISYILRIFLCVQIKDKFILLLLTICLFREVVFCLLKVNDENFTPIIKKIIPIPLILLTNLLLIYFAKNLMQFIVCIAVAFSHYYLWFYKRNKKRLYSCDFIVNFIFLIYYIVNNIGFLVIESIFLCYINFSEYKKIYINKKENSKT